MAFSETLQQARLGDREAVERLLAEWRPWLRQRATGLLPAAVAARLDESDVVQNTLINASRNLAQFRGRSAGEFANWLHRILQRQAARQTRYHQAQRRRVQREYRPLWQGEFEPETAPIQPASREQQQQLRAALQTLPVDLREVVVCRVFHERSFNGMSQQLGRSPRVLRRQWTEALRQLARWVHDGAASSGSCSA